MFQWDMHRGEFGDLPVALNAPPQPVRPEKHASGLLRLPARVGRYGHSMLPEMALALAMGLHARLGAKSPVRALCTDTMRRVAEAWVVHPPC